MYVDIHTHKSVDSNYPAIRNLTFSDAENRFSSNVVGLFSLGFHPWQAGEFSVERMDKLTAWTAEGRLAAIGECGLDKYSQFPLEVQMHVLEQQITLSEKMMRPLIIHCVGCFNELFELKKQLNPRQLWTIHGFRGKPQLAMQALKAGCALSFGEHFNPESVRITPIDSLFAETDESRLSISEIYHSLSNIKKCHAEDLNAGENLLNRLLA